MIYALSVYDARRESRNKRNGGSMKSHRSIDSGFFGWERNGGLHPDLNRPALPCRVVPCLPSALGAFACAIMAEA